MGCRVSLAVTAALGLAACFDGGYDIEPPESYPDFPPGVEADAGSASSDGGPSIDCDEGPVEPMTTGRQIRFLAGLAVDKTNLTIKSGDIVTWTNLDSEKHTATAGAPGAELPLSRGGFESGRMSTGIKWAYRFCRPRTVIWFCATHPKMMNGYRLIVEE